jgi:malate dehydrogenase (oxaloacetate-decarboxylating)(NADP+)
MFSLRQRRGVTRREAAQLILNRNVFGSMMVRLGDADALVGGLTQHYPDTIRPALQVIEVRHGMAAGFGRLCADHSQGRHLFPGRCHRQYRA